MSPYKPTLYTLFTMLALAGSLGWSQDAPTGNAQETGDYNNTTITNPETDDSDPESCPCGEGDESTDDGESDESDNAGDSGAEGDCTNTTATGENNSVRFTLGLGKVRYKRPKGFYEMELGARKIIHFGPTVDRFSYGTASKALLKQEPFNAPKLILYQTTLNAASYTPAALKFKNVNVGTAEVLKSNGVLRQIATENILTDITATAEGGTLIRQYLRNGVGAKDGSGFYAVSASQSFKEVTISNPNAANFTQLQARVEEREGLNFDTLKVSGWKWTQQGITGEHKMEKLSGPSLLVFRRDNLVREDIGNGKFRQIRTVEEAGDIQNGEQPALHVVKRTLEEYQNFGNGQERTTKRVDAYEAPEAITTEYSYFTDQNNSYTYLRLKDLRRSDGFWEQYKFERNGEARVARVERISTWKNSAFGDAVNSRQFIYTFEPARMGIEERVMGQVIRREFQQWAKLTDGTFQITRQRETGTGLLTSTASYYSDTAPEPQTGRIALIRHEDGTVERFTYAADGSNVVTTHESGAPSAVVTTGPTTGSGVNVGDGTRVVTKTNAYRRLVEETKYDIASGLRLSKQKAETWDTFGRPTKVVFDDDANDYTERALNCCGPETERGRDGSVTTYHHDDFKRIVSQSTVLASRVITTRYSYEPELVGGRTLPRVSVFRAANGNGEEFVSQAVMDLEGRTVLIRNPDANGDGLPESTSTSYAALNEGRAEITVTRPDGSTEITTMYADGQTERISGTAVADVRYIYGIHAQSGGGTYKKTIRLNANGEDEGWTASYRDLVGRVIRIERTAFDGQIAVDMQNYNAQGRCELVQTAGQPAVKTIYSVKGELIEQWTDRNGDNQFNDVTINGVQDACIKYAQDIVNHAECGVSQRVRSWIRAEGNTDVLNNATWTRMDGLKIYAEEPGRGVNVISRSKPFDGASSSLTVKKDTNSAIITQTQEDSSINANGETITIIKREDAAGNVIVQTKRVSNAFGQTRSSSDGRGNTTTFTNYPNNAQRSATNAKGETTIWLRDTMGRATVTCLPGADPNNAASTALKTYTRYTLSGNKEATWGALTYPVRYAFDEQGRTVSMTTFRSDAPASATFPYVPGAGDTTMWIYDNSSGLLRAKQFSNNTQTIYSYDVAGNMTQRFWARGVTTTYRHIAGQIVGIDYSDSTPDVTLSYDRSGRIAFASNAIATYNYQYDPATLRLVNETVAFGALNRTITRGYDVAGRPASVTLGIVGRSVEHEVGYRYGSDARMQGVSAAGLPNLVGKDYAFEYGYLSNSDLLRNVTGPVHKVINSYEAERSMLALKMNTHSSGALISGHDYTVNALGQRTSVARTGEGVSSMEEGGWNWFYNERGEMTAADNRSLDATSNQAYGYDSIGNRRWESSGHADLEEAPQQVPATAAKRASYSANNLNQYSELGPVLGGSSSIPSHDLDGNLIDDAGQNAANQPRSYVWDAENRLIAVKDAGNNVIASYSYDPFSRRIAKTASNQTALFLYDGWNLLAEYSFLNAESSIINLHAKYVWGLDLSGTLQSAGGVGGLLASNVEGVWRHYGFDANGNVTELLDSTGAVTAHYEYGPFGEILQKTGEAESNPFRFSTHYTDAETGLSYAKQRFYSPTTGRWISRDPIGEQGGPNLFAYVRNEPIFKVDPFGLNTVQVALTEAMASGNVAEIEAILEASGSALGEASVAAARALLQKIAQCEAIWATYKALGCKGCRECKTKNEAAANIACLTAEIAGRTAYIAAKCDYCLAGSIARGSVLAEAGHKTQLAEKTWALTKCTARALTLP